MARFYSKSKAGFFSDSIHSTLPDDAVEVATDAYAALFAAQGAGKVIQADESGAPVAVEPPGPTTQQQAAALGAAVKQYIDAAAQALGYDNIISAVSYADDPTVPAFQAQGQALRAWRANVWKDATPIMNTVLLNPAIPVPTPAELIASLPVFVPPTV